LLRGQLDGQVKALTNRVDALQTELNSVRQSRSGTAGGRVR